MTLTLKPTPSDSFLAALSAAQNAAGVARGAFCLGLGNPVQQATASQALKAARQAVADAEFALMMIVEESK